MACIFCGRTGKLTNEHVFPQWLLEVIPGDGRVQHEWIAPAGSKSKSRKWTTDVFSLTAKVVCERCNNGWMNDLEEGARPFLESLIRGHGRTLYDHGRQQVAYWALKTAMMVDWAQEPPHQCVPKAYYPELFEVGGILSNCVVWLGACDFAGSADARHRSLHLQTEGETSSESGGFGASLKVGHLVIEVIRVGLEEGLELETGDPPASLLQRIWPANGPVSWPPPLRLTREQVMSLGDLITSRAPASSHS
jgi:hypothetical protein